MPPAPPRLTLVLLNSKKGHLWLGTLYRNISWWPWSSSTSSEKTHWLKWLIPEMQRCPLHPQVQGTVLREVLKQQEEHPCRDEGCSRDTLVERVQVPLSISTQPSEHKPALGSLTRLLHCKSQTKGAWGHCWWLGCTDWFGSRGTGGGWGESRPGADRGDAQAGGKRRVLEGLRASFIAQTHLFREHRLR